MLAVRTVILHYPEWHTTLSQRLHQVLRTWPLRVLVLEELPCGEHRHVIEERMRQFCDREEVDWLITLGGTWPAPGPSSDEPIPLATAQILERDLPGMAVAMRTPACAAWPQAQLDAGRVGIRGVTFILNLPAHAPLLTLYLETLQSAVPALLQMLRGEATSLLQDASDPADNTVVHGLQAREFAAFRATHSPFADGE